MFKTNWLFYTRLNVLVSVKVHTERNLICVEFRDAWQATYMINDLQKRIAIKHTKIRHLVCYYRMIVTQKSWIWFCSTFVALVHHYTTERLLHKRESTSLFFLEKKINTSIGRTHRGVKRAWRRKCNKRMHELTSKACIKSMTTMQI